MSGCDDFYEVSDEEQAARLTVLAQSAARHWDGGFTNLRLVKYRENAVFSADCPDGRRVAVRVHRHGYHSDAALTSELHWMHEIGRSGAVEVPGVVPTSDGSLTARVTHPTVPEARRVSVLDWLAGTPVGTSEDGVELDHARAAELYFDAGVLAASLHNMAVDMAIPTGFTRHAWDEHGLVGPAPLWGRFWEHPTLTDAEREVLARARSASAIDLYEFGKDDGNYSLIHADFVPENLLDDDGVLKLIDFDDCGYGWHMFELATALYFTIDQSHHADITAALIAGYRTRRPLPRDHEVLLPMFLFLRGTTYLGWIRSRPETETAKTMGPMLIERVCTLARRYLETRAAR